MSVAENKELLKRAAQALNHREDRSGWFGYHAPSVRAHGLGPTPLDMAGMQAFYMALLGGFPDLAIHIDELVGEGDKVVWRVTASGTHTGTFQGVPPTGNNEALHHYNKAVNAEPKNSTLYINKGGCLAKLNRYYEALACFNKAIKYDPGNRHLWSYKASIYEKMGENAEAINCYNKALGLVD